MPLTPCAWPEPSCPVLGVDPPKRPIGFIIYLGQRLIAETNSATGAPGTRYAHTDPLGSPVAWTNPSAQLLTRTRFEPYGATQSGTDPAGIGFTGHVNDAHSGLVNMQQRYYDPLPGRFLSVDPVVTDAHTGSSFGRYHYANNNPYRYVDPSGTTAEEVKEITPGQAYSAEIYAKGNSIAETLSSAMQTAYEFLAGGPVAGGAKAVVVTGAVVKGAKAAKGALAGGGGTLEKLTAGEIQRIQHAANKAGTEIHVVGSRVSPNKALRADSDYDYVVNANNKIRGDLKGSAGSKLKCNTSQHRRSCRDGESVHELEHRRAHADPVAA